MKNLYDFDWEWGKLQTIKLGEKKHLKEMSVRYNKLGGTWNLQKFPQLEWFGCDHNKIKKIYARGHKYLEGLSCRYNNLQKLDVRNTKKLQKDEIHFDGNPHIKVYRKKGKK